MTVENVNDIDFREADYFTDSDRALILTEWELDELEHALTDWIETHSIIQVQTAARIVNAIKDFKKRNSEEEE